MTRDGKLWQKRNVTSLRDYDAREIVRMMPDIQNALRLALTKRLSEEMKMRARIMLAWAEGNTMQQVARGLFIGAHRVHRTVNSCVDYFNKNAADAPDAWALVKGFLEVPPRNPWRPRLPDDLRNRVLDLRRQKRSYREIADTVKCSRGTVANICTEAMAGR